MALQPLLAVEFMVANNGWMASAVRAVSRRRRGPQANLYRTCHPAILGHRGRRLETAQPGVGTQRIRQHIAASRLHGEGYRQFYIS
jgi:hypothetical protein